MRQFNQLVANLFRSLRDILTEVKSIRKDVSNIKAQLQTNLDQRNSKFSQISRRYHGGKIAQNSKARELCIALFEQNVTYTEIVAKLNKIQGFKTSRAAVARYWAVWRREEMLWKRSGRE